jgi:hypothetical protein
MIELLAGSSAARNAKKQTLLEILFASVKKVCTRTHIGTFTARGLEASR